MVSRECDHHECHQLDWLAPCCWGSCSGRPWRKRRDTGSGVLISQDPFLPPWSGSSSVCSAEPGCHQTAPLPGLRSLSGSADGTLHGSPRPLSLSGPRVLPLFAVPLVRLTPIYSLFIKQSSVTLLNMFSVSCWGPEGRRALHYKQRE